MNRALTILALAGLIAAAPHAPAQLKVTGSVTGGWLGSDVNAYNKFRFEEYRDLSNGPILGADIAGESDTYYLRFFGENIGREDQFLELKGGSYGRFKYSIHNNDIIHHLTSNALTPYSGGIGTNSLTFVGGAAASTNPARWTPFEYSIKHENYGGTFELQSSLNSPFYFRATANQKQTQGIRPLATTANTFGGPVVELPAPVDYTTTDVSGEVGWLTKTTHYSINLAYSRFVDHFDTLFFSLPQSAGNLQDQLTLASDNEQWKLGANAMWKKLPLDSTLALRATYSTLKNTLPVRTTWRTTGVLNTVNASSPLYNGDIIHQTFSGSWTAQPARALDSRLYYNYDEKKNHSTEIVFTPTAGTTGRCDFNLNGVATANNSCTTEAFHYRKHNLGVDLGYRLNRENKLSGGWDYLDTTRERLDFEETKDHKLYVEWKNSSLDLLSSKVKYQHLQRRSDFLLGAANVTTNTGFFNYYFRRFDLTDNDQDLVKVVLDSNPAPFLDLGGELIYKQNHYKNTQLGRNNDERQELYLTASFGDPKRFRVTAFFDYETTEYNSTHQQGNPTTAPACTAPCSTSAARFVWEGKVKDKNYVVGLGADWPLNGRLKLVGSLIWQETDGTADFAANPAFYTPQNITAYDSFRKTALNLKGIYAVDKNFDLTIGYAYEQYHNSDISMDGYNYTLQGNFLSGAYAFPNYNANIIYATLKYKFQ